MILPWPLRQPRAIAPTPAEALAPTRSDQPAPLGTVINNPEGREKAQKGASRRNALTKSEINAGS
jgi:hypothetical protein